MGYDGDRFDRILGVDVVGPDDDVHRNARIRGRERLTRFVRVEQRLAEMRGQLVVRDIARHTVLIGVVVTNVRLMRPDVVWPGGVGAAMAAAAGKHHIEKVDHAVLVGVERVVVDVRVRQRRGIVDNLGRRAAAIVNAADWRPG